MDTTIVIPIGPFEQNRAHLEECLWSVIAQDVRPTEILLVNDQSGLMFGVESANRLHWGVEGQLYNSVDLPDRLEVRIWCTPWLAGVAHAFNFGVALAKGPLVIMLGSDDVLQPWAIANCLTAWEAHQDPLGYYWMDVEYMDTGDLQALPCHAAMVHKDLWHLNGGFPVESAVGAPDTMLVSMMIVHGAEGHPAVHVEDREHPCAGHLIRVDSDAPPYLYRRDQDTDTGRRAPAFAEAIRIVRDVVTRDWRPPTWT